MFVLMTLYYILFSLHFAVTNSGKNRRFKRRKRRYFRWHTYECLKGILNCIIFKYGIYIYKQKLKIYIVYYNII